MNGPLGLHLVYHCCLVQWQEAILGGDQSRQAVGFSVDLSQMVGELGFHKKDQM